MLFLICILPLKLLGGYVLSAVTSPPSLMEKKNNDNPSISPEISMAGNSTEVEGTSAVITHDPLLIGVTLRMAEIFSPGPENGPRQEPLPLLTELRLFFLPEICAWSDILEENTFQWSKVNGKMHRGRSHEEKCNLERKVLTFD